MVTATTTVVPLSSRLTVGQPPSSIDSGTLTRTKSKPASTASSHKSRGTSLGITTTSGRLLSLLPPAWLPYAQLMRLDRPAGLWAYYSPHAIGTGYAACLSLYSRRDNTSTPPPPLTPATLLAHAVLFLAWCVLLRGATCAWNDVVDVDFDRRVARCRGRPLARGAVSVPQALWLTAALLVLCAAFALVFFAGVDVGIRFIPSSSSSSLASAPSALHIHATVGNPTVLRDAAVVTLLLLAYPFAKRVTHYPQLVLGFPFAFAVPLACGVLGVDAFVFSSPHSAPSTTSSVFSHLDLLSSPPLGSGPATLCLILAIVAWTVSYDTIYAHQDLADDVAAGVKGMAVRFATTTKELCASLGLLQVALLVQVGRIIFPGFGFESGGVYYLVGGLGTAVALATMVTCVKLEEPKSCGEWFMRNFWLVGGAMASGFVAQYAVGVMEGV